MEQEFIAILNKAGDMGVATIKTAMQALNMKATGSTEASLTYKVTQLDSLNYNLTIAGASYFFTLESGKGRRPGATGTKGGKSEFLENLKIWAQIKLGDENAAYAIRKNIIKRGNEIYRGKKGVNPNEIANIIVKHIEKEVVTKVAANYIEKIKQLHGNRAN